MGVLMEGVGVGGVGGARRACRPPHGAPEAGGCCLREEASPVAPHPTPCVHRACAQVGFGVAIACFCAMLIK